MKKRHDSKKGLSEVITTLIVIGVSLVAITIIWVVVRNIISSGADEIEVSKFVVDLEIQEVKTSTNGIDIVLKRNAGQGALKEIVFAISDGTNTQTFKQEVNIEELEQKTFTVDYTGPVKTVSVSPVSSSGTQGSVADESIQSGYNAVKLMPGLVSWWKFEGNENDEMGLNNGNDGGSDPELVSGKYGSALEFKNIGEVIIVPDSATLRLENSNMTTVAWVKYIGNPVGGLRNFVSKGYPRTTIPGYLLGSDQSTNNVTFRTNTTLTSSTATTNNIWYHFSGTQNFTLSGNRITRIYLNGAMNKELIGSSALSGTTAGRNLEIGANTLGFTFPANAVIDEVMIFNRTLSDSEIQALYNLDLSN